jgi:hypothetical protein
MGLVVTQGTSDVRLKRVSRLQSQRKTGPHRLTVDMVPVKGETQHYEVSGKFDGKDNPVKGNNPDADTNPFSKIDARTYEVVQKMGGKWQPLILK